MRSLGQADAAAAGVQGQPYGPDTGIAINLGSMGQEPLGNKVGGGGCFLY
jgi:hypothetical protein